MNAPAAAVSPGRHIVRNTALVGAGNAVRMVVGFVTTILVTDYLGNQYGLLVGAQRYVDFFKVLVMFGLNTLLVRGLASGRGDRGELLGSVLALRALLGAAFVALALGSAALSGYLPGHRELLAVFVAVALAFTVVETLRGFCDGHERMGRTAPLPVTRSLFMLAGVSVVVWSDGGLLAMAGVFLGVQLLQVGVAIALMRELLRGVRLRARAATMGRLAREGPHYMAVGFAYAALRSLSVMALTRFSSAEQASLYGAALNFVDLLLMLPLLAQRAFLPVFSREDHDSRRLARQGIQSFAVVLIPAAVGLSVLAGPAVALYPSGVFHAAAPVLRVLALGLVFTCVTSVGITYLTGAGDVRRILVAYGMALPVQAVLCSALAARHGALGVAWGTLTAQALLAVGVHTGARARGLRVPWAALLRHGTAAAVMAAAIWPMRGLFVAAPAALGAVLYAAVLLAICPSGSLERRVADRLIAPLRGR